MFINNYNEARAFNRTTGCIFKCETKMKLAKTIKNGLLSNNFFARNILSNTEAI